MVGLGGHEDGVDEANGGELSSPVVDSEGVVGEKTCGGGSSLLCLIRH